MLFQLIDLLDDSACSNTARQIRGVRPRIVDVLRLLWVESMWRRYQPPSAFSLPFAKAKDGTSRCATSSISGWSRSISFRDSFFGVSLGCQKWIRPLDSGVLASR
jgi:hypothetical protein